MFLASAKEDHPVPSTQTRGLAAAADAWKLRAPMRRTAITTAERFIAVDVAQAQGK